MKKRYSGYLAIILFICLSVNVSAQKKVLYVDSYHEGYEWSDGITKGIKDNLKSEKVELKVFRMDTKNNPGDSFKKSAAEKAIKMIESFNPDIVIASDDNASKYLIAPYYKDKKLPFVFCGVNWDASGYGFPCSNVTGILEVALIPQLTAQLKNFAKGDKIAYLSGDDLTARKEAENYKSKFNLKIEEVYVKSFSDWKKNYKKLQTETDMIIIGNNASIKDWNEEEGKTFVESNTLVPTGTIYQWMTPFSLVGLTILPEEHGEWAAKTALKILGGTPPNKIPLAKNKRGKLFVNLKIAKPAKFLVKPALLKNATIIK
ncbi:MAG: hypothetical protein JEY94_08125 [Melioribacteraceae bacterium]|nr:hypothetical protein [Melioribacteraceae bacterium]